MAAMGSVRAEQGGARPQALRQPPRHRSADGDPARARRLYAAPGRHEHLGRSLRSDHGERSRRQGRVLRSNGRQGLSPPDLLRSAEVARPHVSGHRCKLRSLSRAILRCNISCALATPASSSRSASPNGAATRRSSRKISLVELPRGDFAATMLRNLAIAIFLELLWQRLEASSDTELAGIAGKAVKEARYHREHAADWVVRLGDGTAESKARMVAALDWLWPYVAEIFEGDGVDEQAASERMGPRWSDLRDEWRARFAEVIVEAGLALPAERPFRSTGKNGRHSEHLGYILAEMQHLQRAFPGLSLIHI